MTSVSELPELVRVPERVVLVGAPGSGKSTVGPLLAAELGLPFVDVDQVIEERVGKPVAEIFADDGEAVFRAFEESTTAELLGGQGVLALGGGAVLSPITRQALRGHRVIWLQVSVSHAVQRVGHQCGPTAAARQCSWPDDPAAGGPAPAVRRGRHRAGGDR